jgi:hypothetical protein
VSALITVGGILSAPAGTAAPTSATVKAIAAIGAIVISSPPEWEFRRFADS